MSKKDRFKEYYIKNPYTIKRSKDGKKYVDLNSVRNDTLNVSNGNSKTGLNVTCFNFPIYYTCDHNCECYKKGLCYGCKGTYNMGNNLAMYSENLAFFLNHSNEEFIGEFERQLKESGNELSRIFTIGDIPRIDFLDCINRIAKDFPDVKFWMYTKKYGIVNLYCDQYGVDYIARNFTIIFSHWMNEDGTYYPMYNPYEFPTSEFIPVGKEYLLENVTHVCPCSDPDVLTECKNCDHPCYELKHGQSMALLEHSTAKSKERDTLVKKAHDILKKRKKERKKKTA